MKMKQENFRRKSTTNQQKTMCLKQAKIKQNKTNKLNRTATSFIIHRRRSRLRRSRRCLFTSFLFIQFIHLFICFFVLSYYCLYIILISVFRFGFSHSVYFFPFFSLSLLMIKKQKCISLRFLRFS